MPQDKSAPVPNDVAIRVDEILTAAQFIDDDFGSDDRLPLRKHPERREVIRSRIFENLAQDEEALMAFFDTEEGSPTAYEMRVRLDRTPFRTELRERFPRLMQKMDDSSRAYVEWADEDPELLRNPRGWLPADRPTFREAAAYFDLDPKKIDKEAYWDRSNSRRNEAGDDVRTLLEVIRHGSVIDDAIRRPGPALSQTERLEISARIAFYGGL